MPLCLAQDPSSNSANSTANIPLNNTNTNLNNGSGNNNANSNNNNNNNIKTAYKKALRADMARTFGCLMRNTSSGNNVCPALTKSSSFSVRSSSSSSSSIITANAQISTDDSTPATPSSTFALFAKALCFSEPSSPNSGPSTFSSTASSLPSFGQYSTCSAPVLAKHSPFDFDAPVANLRRCVDALMSQSKSARKEWFDISFETLRNFDFEMHRQVGMCESALHPINRDKNRYHTVLANECSRVKLQSIPNKEGSDYINANHIPGSLFGIPHSYVATQAPIPETFGDFWRMIWETDSPLILMLSNEYESGRLKCHKYWPDLGQSQVLDQIEVETIVQKQHNQDIVVREFRLRQRQQQPLSPSAPFSSSGRAPCSSVSSSDCGVENRPRAPTASSFADQRSPTSPFHAFRGFYASSSSPFASAGPPPPPPPPPPSSCVEEKNVVMIQFLSWPDHGVPRDRTSIHRFLETVDSFYEQSQQRRLEAVRRPPGPITVHCSAGIGRTGTFIAIHVTLSLLKQHLSQRQSDTMPLSPSYGKPERFKFDIFNIVRKLKIQRIGMVQQKEQFVFCYTMVLDEAERLGLHWSDSSDDDDISGDLETTILSSLSSRQLRELNYIS